MVHALTPVICTVVPDTEQLPVAANCTARPDVAVAETVNAGSPNVLSASAPNAIVCAARSIVNDRSTSAAGL